MNTYKNVWKQAFFINQDPTFWVRVRAYQRASISWGEQMDDAHSRELGDDPRAEAVQDPRGQEAHRDVVQGRRWQPVVRPLPRLEDIA